MTTLHHLMILDSSGSMYSVKESTIEGFNGQLQTIRESVEKHPDQKHIISLVVFGLYDTPVEFKIWKKEISEAEDLTIDTYTPQNGTPLHDAIGKAINGLKNEIVDDLKDDSTKVFVTIFTDGKESGCSEEFTGEDCKSIIEEVRETGQWEVALIGCDEGVFNKATSLGISAGNTVRYVQGEKGTKEAYRALSCARMSFADSVSDGTYDQVKASLIDMSVDKNDQNLSKKEKK